jgi:hypothetical protein
MAYMLSAQLAAMELNVEAGFVNGSSLVYAPGTNSANGLGFATVADLMTEANAELTLHPTALAGDSLQYTCVITCGRHMPPAFCSTETSTRPLG